MASDGTPNGTPGAQIKAGYFRDEGCDLHPHCLTCPLSRCRYEMAPGTARTELRRLRLIELLAEGKTMGEAAADLGVGWRTVYRLWAMNGRR